MQYSDRLCGWPVTGFAGDERAITVLYGDAGYVRKTLLPEPGTETDAETPAEETADPDAFAQDVDGLTVYFSGSDDNVTAARWTDNGFDYTIQISGDEKVSAEEMAEYIRMIR